MHMRNFISINEYTYENEWVILTLFWLHEFQFLLRLYKSMLLSCLAR